MRNLPADDAFGKSLHRFVECINDAEVREKNYEKLVRQAKLVDQFRIKATEQ